MDVVDSDSDKLCEGQTGRCSPANQKDILRTYNVGLSATKRKWLSWKTFTAVEFITVPSDLVLE